jgi:ABC-type cobalamin/Fe3+-siderophores transport system ATPase subunit
MIEFRNVTFTHPEGRAPVFTDLSLSLPDGIISCIGQNGTGKSTLLLLAGGRLLPDQGTVLIDGRDTRSFLSEEARAEYAAFIYQNMEFETEDRVGELLAYVLEHGFLARKDRTLIDELVAEFELDHCLGASLSRVSKGELQRTILAFSLLYGSRHLLMDEPVFALEDAQKTRTLAYITGRVRKNGGGWLYSLHELELSRTYSDYLLIFSKNAPPRLGPTGDLYRRDIIEEAYEAPLDALKRRESLFRDVLIRLDKVHRERLTREASGADGAGGNGTGRGL